MVKSIPFVRGLADQRAATSGYYPVMKYLTLVLLIVLACTACYTTALAQAVEPQQPPLPGFETNTLATDGTKATPYYWFLLTTAIAFLVPVGFILISVAALEGEYAWNAALGGLAAVALAAVAYWAVGFALHFGGVGLVYNDPGLRQLVWEWSPLSTNWGTGWGVAGLGGWFLSGVNVSVLTYTLFLTNLPAVITAAALPVVALRGRAPAVVTLVLALLIAGIVYPLAGNWVQGGGWLGALGRNLGLGHGLVDFGGAGTVHLVSAGFALAALVVWIPRRRVVLIQRLELPPVHLPLLAVIGSLLVLAGNIGWQWNNPLQAEYLGELALIRGSVNSVLVAAGGIIPPLLYTWFVTGQSEPMTCARGLVGGVVAGLAVGPFVQPGVAFAIGMLVGAAIPFAIFVVDGFWHLDDATGVVVASGIPAIIGLLLVGIFADGMVGSGWQMTGSSSYLGVKGQGVSGLFVVNGYQLDFPGQLQAQAIGILSLSLWGFLSGMLCCIPLGLLFHTLEQGDSAQRSTLPVVREEEPLPPFNSTVEQEHNNAENYPPVGQLNKEWETPLRRERRPRR
jgi:Amt family ammonium transporter